MWSTGAFGYLLDYILWWVLFLSLVIHTWCFFRFFPWQKRRRTGLVLGNLLVFGCLVGVAGMIGESYYRFFAVSTDAFGMSLPARRWFALYADLNSMGFRDEEWTLEKPAGVRRIAFVGDSFAYGWGIEDPSDRFTERIQAGFDREAPGRVEVMTVAKPGWGTPDQIEPIERLVQDFDVDEVILCYVPNDIEKLLPRTEAFDPVSPPEPVLFDPERSPLVDHLYRRIVVPRLPTVRNYHDWLADGFADDAIWREHRHQLAALDCVCRDGGATFRVALFPFLRTTGEKFKTPELHATLAGFFRANQIPVLDLSPILDMHPAEDLVVSGADPHPNELAHRLFADGLWEAFFADRRDVFGEE